MKAAIPGKGIESSLNPDYTEWLAATTNRNLVLKMASGTTAIFDDQPDQARQATNRAVKSEQVPMQEYGPDDAYPEGYSYWEYGTSFDVLLSIALEKLGGHDLGLVEQAGFLNTDAYLENITGSSGNAFTLIQT